MKGAQEDETEGALELESQSGERGTTEQERWIRQRRKKLAELWEDMAAPVIDGHFYFSFDPD